MRVYQPPRRKSRTRLGSRATAVGRLAAANSQAGRLDGLQRRPRPGGPGGLPDRRRPRARRPRSRRGRQRRVALRSGRSAPVKRWPERRAGRVSGGGPVGQNDARTHPPPATPRGRAAPRRAAAIQRHPRPGQPRSGRGPSLHPLSRRSADLHRTRGQARPALAAGLGNPVSQVAGPHDPRCDPARAPGAGDSPPPGNEPADSESGRSLGLQHAQLFDPSVPAADWNDSARNTAPHVLGEAFNLPRPD